MPSFLALLGCLRVTADRSQDEKKSFIGVESYQTNVLGKDKTPAPGQTRGQGPSPPFSSEEQHRGGSVAQIGAIATADSTGTTATTATISPCGSITIAVSPADMMQQQQQPQQQQQLQQQDMGPFANSIYALHMLGSQQLPSRSGKSGSVHSHVQSPALSNLHDLDLVNEEQLRNLLTDMSPLNTGRMSHGGLPQAAMPGGMQMQMPLVHPGLAGELAHLGAHAHLGTPMGAHIAILEDFDSRRGTGTTIGEIEATAAHGISACDDACMPAQDPSCHGISLHQAPRLNSFDALSSWGSTPRSSNVNLCMAWPLNLFSRSSSARPLGSGNTDETRSSGGVAAFGPGVSLPSQHLQPAMRSQQSVTRAQSPGLPPAPQAATVAAGAIAAATAGAAAGAAAAAPQVAADGMAGLMFAQHIQPINAPKPRLPNRRRHHGASHGQAQEPQPQQVQVQLQQPQSPFQEQQHQQQQFSYPEHSTLVGTGIHPPMLSPPFSAAATPQAQLVMQQLLSVVHHRRQQGQLYQQQQQQQQQPAGPGQLYQQLHQQQHDPWQQHRSQGQPQPQYAHLHPHQHQQHNYFSPTPFTYPQPQQSQMSTRLSSLHSGGSLASSISVPSTPHAGVDPHIAIPMFYGTSNSTSTSPVRMRRGGVGQLSPFTRASSSGQISGGQVSRQASGRA